MKFPPVIITASMIVAVAAAAARGVGPAHFWISASRDNPVISEAPTINVPEGRQRTLYIWAQPATDDNGVFRTLKDFSLDVTTQTAMLDPEPQPFVDFIDGTFKVYNDVVGTQKRYFQVADSLRSVDQGGPLLSETSASQVLDGQPDAIKGLGGLYLFSENVVGIGHANDPHRVLIGNAPAWRVAEFAVRSLQSSGTNTLFLQIGFQGMVFEGSADPNVVLGDNALPVYNANLINHRTVNLTEDTFDVQINAVTFAPGDYDSDGVVGPSDYTYWRGTFGQTVQPGDGADGNGNGVIDAADYVFWRKRLAGGTGSGQAGNSLLSGDSMGVPEPGIIAHGVALVAIVLSYRKRKP